MLQKSLTKSEIYNSIFNKIEYKKLNYDTFLTVLYKHLKIDILIINANNFLNKNGRNYILYLKETENENITTVLSSKKFFLTYRENEVAQLILKGLSNKEISEYLNISINTVRTHIGRIISKTGSTNKTSAVYKLCNSI
ncbi:MAG: helix-turn-helix transcriptional regulator [Fusobacteriaceae bacterium]|nr:helix-turn-helix transcriptional regulator [Fusobacteriaceae bacterium]